MTEPGGILTRVMGDLPQEASAHLPGLGRDLVVDASRGAFDDLVTRPELEALYALLLRKSRASVAILGSAGVGKTALVETLAREIAHGKAPAGLAGLRILEVDLAGLVAGSSLRGSFEERARGLLTAAKRPGVLVFADELHLIAGAGQSSQGSLDFGQILKPALARGEIRLLGATTEAEWRRAVAADPALERRFEELRLSEPSRDQTRAMVASQGASLERHHGIRIGAEAVDAAIEISERRLPDRRQPDKAANLLDVACARVRLAGGDSIDRSQLEAACECGAAPLVAPGDLEERLAALVFGQDEAVRAATRAVRRGVAGLRERAGPLASVLLAGPEGCGKTHLARALARTLFLASGALFRFEGELAAPGAASRLLGAPPGYVRSEEEGLLAAALAQTAGSAILVFESIDRAEPDVLGVVSRLLEEGRLSTGGGRAIDVSRSVLVLTCRTDGAAGRVGFGARHAESSRAEVLGDSLPASVLARIDEVVVMRELDPRALRRILEARIAGVRERLSARGVQLVIQDEAKLADHLWAGVKRGSRGGWDVERVVEREFLCGIEADLARGVAGPWGGD